ncbi:unnamed protein product [Prorocentrum cordatum]|uniref:Uncharacterized protein n=1 Tax=Prorocentrum cordatum TaxID=2364126 RepID=A0ABN9ULF7_9DINO|nr:unnamed protein product [Polarella glacialis]|mmetsp:Transcript_10827/g.30158  ORF Transcript_10827/g.30158 Transcript_10827/m.30158 type:complete len:112 (-) Transcript_10827:143-478(-)
MARSRTVLPLALALAILGGVAWQVAPAFAGPPRASAAQVDVRLAAAISAGLVPLAVEQPAGAYDSVVAMLQSWLVGGTVLTIIIAAALVAATANPLSKRRAAVAAQVEGKR